MINQSLPLARLGPSNEFNWLVLVTKPNHERSVFVNLTEMGITSLLPLRKEIRQWTDRKKISSVPYFPSYLFVNISMVDRYKVFAAAGAVRYLDSNYHPAVLNERDMHIIKSLHMGQENIEVTSETFEKGDKVLIESGAFKGYVGILVDKKGTRRLQLRLESIQRNLLLDVSTFSLQKISESHGVPLASLATSPRRASI